MAQALIEIKPEINKALKFGLQNVVPERLRTLAINAVLQICEYC